MLLLVYHTIYFCLLCNKAFFSYYFIQKLFLRIHLSVIEKIESFLSISCAMDANCSLLMCTKSLAKLFYIYSLLNYYLALQPLLFLVENILSFPFPFQFSVLYDLYQEVEISFRTHTRVRYHFCTAFQSR